MRLVVLQCRCKGLYPTFQQFPNGTESADYQELCNRRFAGYAQSGIKECPFSFFLLFLLSLPIYLMTQEILEVWLTEVPDFSATFLQLSLMAVTIDSIANPLMVAAAATGNVRRYQTVVGGVIMLVTPIAYVVLKMGADAPSVFIVNY